MDSIELAWEIAQILKAQKSFQPKMTLDLCSGCGVIGFELNFHLPKINSIDFNEVQDVYKSHFEKNRALVSNPGKFQFLPFNYEKLLTEHFLRRYDLIVSNPPYFQVSQGKLSPSDFKNRCRFFIDSSFEKFLLVMDHCLSDQGLAFFLLRPLSDHGYDVLHQARDVLRNRLKLEVLGDIRGTQFIKLSRFTDRL